MKRSLSLSDEVHGELAKPSRRARVPMSQGYSTNRTKQEAMKFVLKITMFLIETDFTMLRPRRWSRPAAKSEDP
jgi:hypothetical protein